MNEKFVITIARGYGSGGRTIGQMLSERLGVEFYDKDLIKLASEESGINEALFGQSDEKTKSVFGKKYTGEIIPPNKRDYTSEENLFNFQAKVIKRLAEEKSCIIVGRCADFVLRGFPNLVRVFVYADEESCIKNVAEVKGIFDRKEAQRKITAIDKERAAYYKSHTGNDWEDVRNYDLCLNSSNLDATSARGTTPARGFEKCVEIICNYLNVALK